MSQQRVEKYIEIVEAGTSPTGITRRWAVRNKRTNETIGLIKWYGANGFRGYCFYPTIPVDADWILFDADCMRMVADFLDDQNRKHREVKSAHKGMRHEG